jgi:galactokinase
VGAGLASSAALTVATARALREAFGLALDEREAALVAHEAEDRFVGAHVGLMDQLACALGRDGEALLIDTRDLSTRRVPLGRAGFELAVIDSGLRHAHATGAYNARRRECEDAARALGVATLRDIGPHTDLAQLRPELRMRARHVVTENERVRSAVAAIDAGDATTLGSLVSRSHASLRNDFAVSVPLIDGLVEAAERDPDVYGARIVGGGFGGSALLIVRPGAARAAAERTIAALGAGGSGMRVMVPG